MQKENGDQGLMWRRNTAQRRLIFALMQQAGGHLDADELYRLAREQESSISLSTVYRNLKLFKDMGLIEERHFTEEHHHYEVKLDVDHHHMVCLGCGEVIDFISPLVDRMKTQVETEQDFMIKSVDIRVEGFCRSCRASNEEAAE